MFIWNSLAFAWSSGCWQLIFGSSAFSKTSLNIWKFMVHVLLKPGLENFEHYKCVRWVQLCSSLSILWHCLSLGLERKLTFSSPVATAEFSKFADILSAELSHIIFQIWNSSTGIPSPLLALFIVMLPKAHLSSHDTVWYWVECWCYSRRNVKIFKYKYKLVQLFEG